MRAVIRYSLIAWLAYSIFGLLFATSYIEFDSALIRMLSIVIPQIGLFYLNLLYLLPNFLDGKSRLNYFAVSGVVIAFVIMSFGLLDIFLDKHYPFHFYRDIERPVFTVFLARFMMSIMPFIISALLSKSLQVRRQREESLELKNKMLEAETKALKAQINPHFLFNSLNNIYSLAQLKSDKTPGAILHLSDILRFITYESNLDYVDLKDELKSITSFIELQYLKDENHENIKVDIDTTNGHYKIAPLMLIPFIENSFKHSGYENKETGWITITIKAANGKIKMTCENSFYSKPGITKDKTGGVGMENVKRRLALTYPDRHKLTIKDNLVSYKVELEITLEK